MEKKLLTLLIGAVLSNQSIAKQNTTENNKNYSTSHILVSIEDVSSPWLLDGDSSAITGLAYPNYWSSPNNLIIAGNLNKRASVIYLGSDGTLHKQDLGTLRSDNSGESNVSAISNDGTTIVGSSDHDNSRLKTGYVSLRNADGSYGKMTPLGSLTSGGPGVNPYAVSSSGNLIVGSGFSRQGVEHLGDYINHAFYSFRNDDGSYQAPQEVAGFGGFTGERSSTAYGVGKLVFGGSNEFLVGGMNHLMEKDSKEQAFIAYKIKDKNEFYHAYSLGSLIGSSGWSEARGTDGSSAIVGASDNIRGGKSAFVSLLQATIKENSMSSNPNGMDDSGNSYKWHMIDLGTAKINNTGSSTALAISPDAEVIVGESANDKTTENQAFFTYRIGVKDRIADFETKDFSKPVTLGSLKSDGGGWSTATSITRSVDGFIVGGQSDTDSGNKHSFLVRLKANDYFEPLPPPVVESTDTVPPLIPDPPAPEPVPPAPEPVPPVPEPVPPVPEPVPPAPEPVPPVPEPVPPAPEPVPPAPEPVPPAPEPVPPAPEPVPPAPEPVPPAPEPVPPAPAPDVTPSKLVDIDNTFNSIEKNAKNLNTLLSLKQYQLRDLMDRDCSSEFGNYCVGVGSYFNNVGHTDSTGAWATFAYKPTPKFRAGISIDSNINEQNKYGYDLQNRKPTVGVFAVYSPSDDFSLRLSAAYGNDKYEVTRKGFSNIENGKGTSRMESFALGLSGKYVLLESKNYDLSILSGVNYTSIKSSGYKESADLDFPLEYGKVDLNTTTIHAGLKTSYIINDSVIMGLKTSIEQNLNYKQDSYSASNKYLGSYINNDVDATKTRLSARPYLNISFNKQHSLHADLSWERSRVGGGSDLNTSLNYNYNF